jgi:cytochrome oxidase Cu insertion factor (SCO1/SenC/PrrC family)
MSADRDAPLHALALIENIGAMAQSRHSAANRCNTACRSLVAGAAFLLLASSALRNTAGAQAPSPAAGSSIHFALTASTGDAVTEANYRGKWLVIYFGYTYCPDICPTTMLEIADALKALGPRADAVQGLFITVDAQRDTASVLADYLGSFDPRLIGLTGPPAQIAAAAKSFHVFYERQDNDDGSYSYDHSSFIYMVDPEGRFVRAIPGSEGEKAIADDLSALIAGH